MPIENVKALLQNYGHFIPYIYFGIISLIATIITVYDKTVAKKPGRSRVPEARLWTVAILGGAVMMYSVMLIISHKTKHRSFMIGLPITVVFQFAILFTISILV